MTDKNSRINLSQENLGGAVSLAASAILLANGDTESALATGSFLAAQVSLMTKGHTAWGYSLGATFFAAGQVVLVHSPAIQDNQGLQLSLYAVAAAWALGALRYPFTVAASKTDGDLSKTLNIIADRLQNISGTANIALKIPGIAAAASQEDYLMTTVIGMWMASDYLAGRIQDQVSSLSRLATSSLDNTHEDIMNTLADNADDFIDGHPFIGDMLNKDYDAAIDKLMASYTDKNTPEDHKDLLFTSLIAMQPLSQKAEQAFDTLIHSNDIRAEEFSQSLQAMLELGTVPISQSEAQKLQNHM